MKSMNKKADIAITLLVIGIIVLCSLALLKFYLSEQRQATGGVNSFAYLQGVYNLAESVKFSNDVEGYEDVRLDSGNLIIEKSFSQGLWNKEEVVKKIGVSFDILEAESSIVYLGNQKVKLFSRRI